MRGMIPAGRTPVRALVVAAALVLAGCASEPRGTLVVPLEERNADRLRGYGVIDVLEDVPSKEAARAAAAVARILAARGYLTEVVAREPSFLLQPVVIVDAARASPPDAGALAGRVALFLPGLRGPAFSRVFFLDDAQDLDDALDAILRNLPGPRR
jgi:hypothetical protein